MSAGSRKKHSSAHKGYQGGDHLEVERLLAGAGNGRDIEQRLGGGAGGEAEFNPESKPSDVIVLSEGGSELAQESAPEAPVVGINAEPVFQQDLTPRDAHMGTNIVAVVTRGLRESLFAENFNASLKHLIELQSVRIKGLRTGFKVGEYSKTQTRVIHAESQAQITWLERQGRHVDNLIHEWADRYNDYLLDAEQAKDNRAYKPKISLEDVSIDVVFFETDSLRRKVIAAWKGVNLYPAHYIGLDSARDIEGYPFGKQHVSAHFAGNYTRGANVVAEAQKLLDGLVIMDSNPYVVAPMQEAGA